jgi:hypothetical protein
MNLVREVFAAIEKHPLLEVVIPVPPLASVSLEPGTRAHEAPASVEYISALCWLALSLMALESSIWLVKITERIASSVPPYGVMNSNP